MPLAVKTMQVFCLYITEESSDLVPFLTYDVKFVLNWISIHNVCKNCKLFFGVQVFHWIEDYLSVFVYHYDVKIDSFFIIQLVLGFLVISTKNAHSSAFILEAGEANKTEVKSDVATNFPNLKGITWSNFRKERNP